MNQSEQDLLRKIEAKVDELLALSWKESIADEAGHKNHIQLHAGERKVLYRLKRFILALAKEQQEEDEPVSTDTASQDDRLTRLEEEMAGLKQVVPLLNEFSLLVASKFKELNDVVLKIVNKVNRY